MRAAPSRRAAVPCRQARTMPRRACCPDGDRFLVSERHARAEKSRALTYEGDQAVGHAAVEYDPVREWPHGGRRHCPGILEGDIRRHEVDGGLVGVDHDGRRHREHRPADIRPGRDGDSRVPSHERLRDDYVEGRACWQQRSASDDRVARGLGRPLLLTHAVDEELRR